MIETERLRLRPWCEADKPAFRAVVNTPVMMEHFGGVALDADIEMLLDAQMALQARDGHCMWAVETLEGALAGISGLRVQRTYPGLAVNDQLEIGWRIGERWWGQGIAREAAAASIAWGWANTDFPCILAWTSRANTRSWGLMERLDMNRRVGLDFAHPRYDPGDPLGAMIVYGIDRPR